ncbi:hypothetical protein PGT21_015409 [Puccinia graminis f. sp. tritici]|uniref:Uncharacterized protein n=1 Tax=Puccinia graminis f. sp. tritici TaxID=56615 RepID=A0A5B0Q6E0_PUCGR|nr:hypothetical protein PGT21_015409 [Puccinia graminis f. sp. tritici]
MKGTYRATIILPLCLIFSLNAVPATHEVSEVTTGQGRAPRFPRTTGPECS